MNAEYPSIDAQPASYDSTPRRRSRGGTVMVALLAFLFGAAVFGWLEWRGYFDSLMADQPQEETSLEAPPADNEAEGNATPAAARSQAARLTGMSGVEARVAMLEDRLSRLDFQANAASGNAARAEGLLIAFAARRMIDRGEPLTFVADQLRVRFGNAQPRAVETIIDFAAQPVTIDQLSARLDALSPELVDKSVSEGSLWDRMRSEVRNLFTLRRDTSAVLGPQARIDRARLMLTARRIPEAIDQVERLPGAEAAEKWIVDANRYEAAQRALDLIETTAMLEPRRLKDAEGHSVEQDSPLATPASPKDGASPAAATSATPAAKASASPAR
ncbi:hypothetical protein B2G71_02445 [Novosphingobium sp. PC22D]|nr:hypothetical protein B2G71_02445 [Novosphingobium sp. PC22D]